MYYRIRENRLYDYADYKYEEDCLRTTIITQEELSEDPSKVVVKNGRLTLNPNYEQEQAEKEAARIHELYMTRSDFFDGMIEAFGIDEDDLLPVLTSLTETLPITEVDKKKALNNFKNALNFYRKHTLFTLLSNVPIPISPSQTILITSEQWDRFFDLTDKKDPEAYKELLPKEVVENDNNS